MLAIHTGPTMLMIADATRRNDLSRAADSRRRAEFSRHLDRPVSRQQRPWWWALARTRTA